MLYYLNDFDDKKNKKYSTNTNLKVLLRAITVLHPMKGHITTHFEKFYRTGQCRFLKVNLNLNKYEKK